MHMYAHIAAVYTGKRPRSLITEKKSTAEPKSHKRRVTKSLNSNKYRANVVGVNQAHYVWSCDDTVKQQTVT